jgi:HEAT repeat protein
MKINTIKKFTLIMAISLGVFVANLHATESLSNQNVIDMLKAGIKAELVKRKIQKSDNNFDVSAKAMINLRKNGVSDDVIATMLRESEKKRSGKLGKINIYIQNLASSRQEARQSGYMHLVRMGSLAKEKMLQTLTENRDPKVRAALAEAMGEMRIEESVPLLKFLLQDPEADVRINSAISLYTLDREGITQIANKTLSQWKGDENANPIDAFIRAAALSGKKENIKQFHQIIKKSELDSEREQAVWAILHLEANDKESIDILTRTMNIDSSSKVRAMAIRTLGFLGNSDTVAPLSERFHKDKENRPLIVQSIYRLNTDKSVPALITFLSEDITAGLSDKIVSYLRKLTQQDFGIDIAKWLSWWEKNELEKAAEKIDNKNKEK